MLLYTRQFMLVVPGYSSFEIQILGKFIASGCYFYNLQMHNNMILVIIKGPFFNAPKNKVQFSPCQFCCLTVRIEFWTGWL